MNSLILRYTHLLLLLPPLKTLSAKFSRFYIMLFCMRIIGMFEKLKVLSSLTAAKGGFYKVYKMYKLSR